jgi:LytS/YehU family sensor histidine kinase
VRGLYQRRLAGQRPRRQIEPHFLFNTLATMRRLLQVDPTEGARLVAHIVRFLHSAQPARDGGHLQQEIDLVSAYLGVVAHRMDGRLQVRFDVAEDLLAHPFPPLTIATLVESAVKHGMAPAASRAGTDESGRAATNAAQPAATAAAVPQAFGYFAFAFLTNSFV